MSRVLGESTEMTRVLPATTAAGLAAWHEFNAWIVSAFLVIATVTFAVSLGQAKRYLNNRKAAK